MADRYANVVHRSFETMNFDCRSDKTRKYETGHNVGRSDLVLTKSGRGSFCEIKTGKTTFPTAKWTPQQRSWAEWATTQNGSEVFYFVIMGKHKPYNKKPILATALLVPYVEFLSLVTTIEQHRKSIPLKITSRTTPKIIRDDDLSIISRWGKFALPWSVNVWTIPADHPFYKYTIQEKTDVRISSAA